MRARSLLRTLAAAAALVTVATVAPTPARAGDPGPFQVFQQWVGGSGVSVAGTYRPIVGNFGGGRGDDIFWYAPGPTPDYLWISSSTRGSFTKVRKDISGTYTPLVGDFAGDRYDDIFWYGSGTVPDTLWFAVDGAPYFKSKAYAVNGVYQPVALDMSVEWALALGNGGVLDTSSSPKDHIIWYRPGTASDLAWQFNGTAGGFAQTSIAIEGSPQLIPLNVDGDGFQDLLAYQPGSGADAIFRQDTGAYLKTPKAVNGTYRPVITGGGYFDQIIWHGPGAATDAYWYNTEGTVGGPGPGAGTSPIATAGPIAPFATRRNTAYLYDPNGPDAVFDFGAVYDALDPDQGPGAQIVSGDFDGDLGLDAFFYRPGTGGESIGFAPSPVFWS